MLQAQVQRRKRVRVTGAAIRKIHAPALQDERIDHHPRQFGGLLRRRIAGEVSEQLRQVDAPVRRDVQQGPRFGQAYLCQMPGAARQ